jgi:hypothetical protein
VIDRPQDTAAPSRKRYVLLAPDAQPYDSPTPGRYGGHRRGTIYGRLDCRAARRAIAAGDYVKHRVFFADEATAVAAGYRPCAVCLPDAYRTWKRRRDEPERRPGDALRRSPFRDRRI